MENTTGIKSAELFADLEEICKQLQIRKQYLNLALSVADKKRTDIEHYIELTALNASQGYRMSRMLKECLKERRDIKNEMEQIDNVLRLNIGVIDQKKIRGVMTKADKKVYSPRVLKDLFNV